MLERKTHEVIRICSYDLFQDPFRPRHLLWEVNVNWGHLPLYVLLRQFTLMLIFVSFFSWIRPHHFSTRISAVEQSKVLVFLDSVIGINQFTRTLSAMLLYKVKEIVSPKLLKTMCNPYINKLYACLLGLHTCTFWHFFTEIITKISTVFIDCFYRNSKIVTTERSPLFCPTSRTSPCIPFDFNAVKIGLSDLLSVRFISIANPMKVDSV